MHSLEIQPSWKYIWKFWKTYYYSKFKYYIRIFIPRKLQSVVKRKEIRYSLHTNNYFEALKKLRQESAKIDSWLEGLGNNKDDVELY